MKVLVVGGAGYIGSHVALELIEEEHNVDIYDNKVNKISPILREKCGIIEGDILNYPFLLSVLEEGKYDCVIHLAALKAVGESMEHPEIYSLNNLNGTINLINAMSSSKTHNLIFSSSAAVYGNPQYLPMDEKHPKNPENYYGFTKLKMEEILEWYARLTPLKFIALRYFNAAGYDKQKRITTLEEKPNNLIPVVMEAAFGIREKVSIFGSDYPTADGTAIRDYIHVTDLAKAHIKSLYHLISHKKSLSLNLGTEKGLSVLEIFNKTEDIVGHKIPHTFDPRRPGDPTEIYASSKEAENILEWKAQESDLNNIISTTYAIYQINNNKK